MSSKAKGCPLFGMNYRKRLLWMAILILILLAAIVIAGDCIPSELYAENFRNKKQAPSLEHLFGTDAAVREKLDQAKQTAATEAQGVADATDVTPEMTSAGRNSGQGFFVALRTKLNATVAMARQKALEVASTMRNALQIKSPSRVMMEIGSFTGQGYEEGLRASMAEAINTAKIMSGQIVTAADLSQTMRVNIPNLNQEIRVANEQSSVPINLDGKQIAEIQGYNNSARIAWQNTKSAKGVGSR